MLILNVADHARGGPFLCATPAILTSSPAEGKGGSGWRRDRGGFVRPFQLVRCLDGRFVDDKQWPNSTARGVRLGAPGGGGRFETFPILAGIRRCLCPWIVSKGQPPRWIPPMKTVPEHPLLLVSRFPASAASVVRARAASFCKRTHWTEGGSWLWGGVQVGEEMEAQDGRILWRCAECAG